MSARPRDELYRSDAAPGAAGRRTRATWAGEPGSNGVSPDFNRVLSAPAADHRDLFLATAARLGTTVQNAAT